MSTVTASAVSRYLGYIAGDPPILGKWRTSNVSIEHVKVALVDVLKDLKLTYCFTPADELTKCAKDGWVSLADYATLKVYYDEGDRQRIIGRVRELATDRLALGRGPMLDQFTVGLLKACADTLQSIDRAAASPARAPRVLANWQTYASATIKTREVLEGTLQALEASPKLNAGHVEGVRMALAVIDRRLAETRSSIEERVAHVMANEGARLAEANALSASDRYWLDTKIDRASKKGWLFTLGPESNSTFKEGVVDHYLHYGQVWLHFGVTDESPKVLSSLAALVRSVEDIIGKGELPPEAQADAAQPKSTPAPDDKGSTTS